MCIKQGMNKYKHFCICGPRIKEICVYSTLISNAIPTCTEGHWVVFCAEDALYQVYADRWYVTLL